VREVLHARALAVALLSAVLLALASCAGWTSSAEASSLAVSVSGEWSTSAAAHWEKGVEHGTETLSVNVKWVETFAGGVWSLSSLGGEVSATGNPIPEIPRFAECHGTLEEAAGAAAAFQSSPPADTITPVTSGWRLSFAEPITSQLLKSTGPGGSLCETAAVGVQEGPWKEEPAHLYSSWGTSGTVGSFFTGGNGGANCHQVSATSNYIEFPGSASAAFPDECTASREFPNELGGNTAWSATSVESTRVIVFTATFPGENGTSTSVAYGPNWPKGKQLGSSDLRDHAIPQAERFCLPYGGAKALLRSGVLRAKRLSAGALAAAGGLTASIIQPFCLASVQRLVRDYKSWKDPPLQSIDVIAHVPRARAAALPTCARYRAKVKQLCNRLRPAYAKLLGAAQHAAAVAQALEETVSREHAAYLAKNSAAISAQDAQLGTIDSQMSAAAGAERSAGRGLAKLLKAAHISLRVSKKQSGKAIATLERDAATLGLSKGELESLGSSFPKPGASNLLTRLGSL
jgi:hypothetical protein